MLEEFGRIVVESIAIKQTYRFRDYERLERNILLFMERIRGSNLTQRKPLGRAN
jgi:hypothetical protein